MSNEAASAWGGAPWDEEDSADAFLSSVAGARALPAQTLRSQSAIVQSSPATVQSPPAPVQSASAPVQSPPAPGNASSLPGATDGLDSLNSAELSNLPPAILLEGLGFEGDWPGLAVQLDVKGLAQQLAYQSELVGLNANGVTLQVPVAQLASGPHVEKVRAALAERLGRDTFELQVEIGSARRTAAAVESARKAEQLRRAELSIQHDPFIQALLRDFDESILPGATQALTPKPDSETRSN